MYSTLFSRDLFSQLDELQREVQSLFEFAPSIRGVARGTFPVLNIGQTPTSVELYAFAPGVDPESITYVGSGQWGQLVQQGQADAALAWEGLRAQWDAIGLDFRYLIGSDFSNDPSNGYVIRASDLEDPEKAAIMTCFLRGVSMGLEFGRLNPQAAAQITYAKFPAVQEQMTPELALESMRQLMWLYNQTNKAGLGYGYSDFENWQSYLDRLFELGQTTRQLEAAEAVSNQLVEGANAFDAERVAADAAAFELAPEWAELELQDAVE